MIRIAAPSTPAEFDIVRGLCWDYRAFLLTLGPLDRRIVETFYPEDRYAALLAGIETEHGPPGGAIRLAWHEGTPVGCGMSHALMPGTSEIKRVYVKDSARGLGVGRLLMEALIAQCRADGFSRIVLDTGKSLVAAQHLYLSLGFRQRGPYQKVPDIARGNLVFFELPLQPA